MAHLQPLGGVAVTLARKLIRRNRDVEAGFRGRLGSLGRDLDWTATGYGWRRSKTSRGH